MFGAAEEAGVDAEGSGRGQQAVEKGRRRGVEPGVEALAPGVENGGEPPMEDFAEPADEGEGGPEVAAEFLGGAGFDAVESVEVEHDAFNEFISQDPAAGLVLLKSLGKVLCRRIRSDSELMLRKAGEMRSHFLDIDY